VAHYKIVQWFASYPCVSSPLNPILHPLPPPLKHNSPLLHTLLTQFHTPVQFSTLVRFHTFSHTILHFCTLFSHNSTLLYSLILSTISHFFSHNSTLLHTLLTQFHTPVQFNTLNNFTLFLTQFPTFAHSSHTIPHSCTV